MEVLRTRISDQSAWVAEDFTSDSSWLHTLSDAELAELVSALQAVKDRGLAPPHFGRDDFHIPLLGTKLKRLSDDLNHGRGFFVIRGMPVDRCALDDIKAMYWGIGTHMGNPVFQNKKGDLVSHVADQGDDYSDRNIRLYSTAAAANPHNDPSDVVGLLCVRAAPVGGTSMIASAMSIYNRILEQHPEYLDVLARGFPHDLRGEGAKRAADEITPPIPVYSYYAGKLSCCLNSKSSTTAREQRGEPLTPFERDAIRCVENYVEDPELRLTMDFRPGDIQFLNNYVILHTRTAFQDGREPDQRRLLLRLWLNLREGRPLAPGMGDRFNNGSRGGVPAMSAARMESNA